MPDNETSRDGLKQRIEKLNISDDLKLLFWDELNKTIAGIKELDKYRYRVWRKDVLKALDSRARESDSKEGKP